MKNWDSADFANHFIELSNDLMCVANFKGYFIYVNPMLGKLLGYSEQELLSKPFIDFVHPDDHSKTIERDSELSKGKAITFFENRYICKDGEIKHIEWAASPVLDEKVIYAIGRNITKRKKQENVLFEKRNLLSKAEKIGDQGSWRWDIKIDKWTFSDNWLRIHGFDHSGISREELMKIAHPEDVSKIDEAFEDALSGKHPYSLEHRIVRQDDGSLRNIKSSGEVHFSNNGKPDFMIGVAQDITERKQAEQALRESEYLYKETQKIAKIGGWSYDVESEKISFTDTIYEIYGTKLSTAEEGIKFYHPDDKERVWNSFSDAISKQKPYDLEVRFINAQGDNLFVRTIGQPLIKNGKVAKIYGNLIDITERKQVQEALHQSLEMMRNSQSLAHICSYSTKLNISEIEKSAWVGSPEFYKIFGIDKTYPHTIEGWANFIHPDYRKEVFEYHESVVKERKIFNREYKIIRINDGVERWVHGTGKLEFDDEGNPIRMHGAIQDITERKLADEALKESELRHRELVSNISDVIVILDKDGIITYKSPNIKQHFGWDVDEMIGKNALFVVHKDDKKRVGDTLIELMKQKNETVRLEFNYACKDGSFRPIELTATNLLDDPIIEGILANYKDISDRKKAETALIENQRLGVMGEMASAVAHDFNNSLQSILGNLELAMLRRDLPTSLEKYLETIKTATLDAATRVQLLQRFGSKTQVKSRHSSINLNRIVEAVVTQSRPLWKDEAEKNGLVISVKPKYGEISMLKGNEGELRLVVYNIIKNSIEAMPDGGEITIETGEEADSIFLRITDTGIGMDEKTKKRVFQPFYSTKGFETGRGLGMSGAYSILQEHHGNICVKKSTPGKGTTMEITFPISENEDMSVMKETEVVYKGIARVLWVDDDKMIREVVKEMLESLGHEGDVARSGEEALKYLAKNEYDLVITDIGMPGMTGWQLANEIKTLFNGKMKVAAVTGWGSQVSEGKKEAHGVGYVIGKPIKLKEVENLIGEVMRF